MNSPYFTYSYCRHSHLVFEKKSLSTGEWAFLSISLSVTLGAVFITFHMA